MKNVRPTISYSMNERTRKNVKKNDNLVSKSFPGIPISIERSNRSRSP